MENQWKWHTFDSINAKCFCFMKRSKFSFKQGFIFAGRIVGYTDKKKLSKLSQRGAIMELPLFERLKHKNFRIQTIIGAKARKACYIEMFDIICRSVECKNNIMWMITCIELKFNVLSKIFFLSLVCYVTDITGQYKEKVTLMDGHYIEHLLYRYCGALCSGGL